MLIHRSPVSSCLQEKIKINLKEKEAKEQRVAQDSEPKRTESLWHRCLLPKYTVAVGNKTSVRSQLGSCWWRSEEAAHTASGERIPFVIHRQWWISIDKLSLLPVASCTCWCLKAALVLPSAEQRTWALTAHWAQNQRGKLAGQQA